MHSLGKLLLLKPRMFSHGHFCMELCLSITTSANCCLPRLGKWLRGLKGGKMEPTSDAWYCLVFRKLRIVEDMVDACMYT